MKTFSVTLMAIFLFLLQPISAMALSDYENHCINFDSCHYNPKDMGCSFTPIADSTAPPNVNQINNTKIIIGIAKTYKLGRQGALIGLMVGLAESSLQNYANSNVPVSLSIPHDEIGSDHDSVGIFQQRPSTDWSTIATGDAAINNHDAVAQLMTPAYAAQAFFGSPPGSNSPPALSKGLQNKSGWESRPPWQVAQSVQASGDPTGSNYRAKQSQAQSLVDQYFDESPEIPLPVPVGSGSGATGGGSAGVGSC